MATYVATALELARADMTKFDDQARVELNKLLGPELKTATHNMLLRTVTQHSRNMPVYAHDNHPDLRRELYEVKK